MNFKITVIVFLAAFFLVFLRYRIAYSKVIKGESVLKYKAIDMGQYDYFRYLFESLIGENRRVFLENKLKKTDWIYISKRDYEQLNQESLGELMEKSYSIRIKFETRSLILGGYSCAKIISFERIKGRPKVSKS